MALAHEEALRFDHDRIGTGHVLLGLLRGEAEDPAARVLRGCGVTLEGGREWVENNIGHGVGGRRLAQPPFTPRLSKKVMRTAWREAKEQGQGRIGTEHILLGLLRERVSEASSMLTDLGVDREAVLRKLTRTHDGDLPS